MVRGEIRRNGREIDDYPHLSFFCQDITEVTIWWMVWSARLLGGAPAFPVVGI